MIKNLGILLLCFVFPISGILAQDYSSASESRRKQLKAVLDYRYKGGFYTFEQDFNLIVEYPEVATQNCILGIVIVNLVVDCDGQLTKIGMKNGLKYGIDEQISQFFNSTYGKWNKCDDERYTKFEIPVQFVLKGTQTNTTDGVLVKEGENPGYACNGDDYYMVRAEKALEKKKGKKAIPFIDKLIQRDPYNMKLYDMKKEAMKYLK
jgi:hypothetical protein